MLALFRQPWPYNFLAMAVLSLAGCPLEAQTSDKPEDSGCELQSFYVDADADGFGNVIYPIEACESPAGYIGNADDCNDLAPDISPGAAELCDVIDNDCDGTVDLSAIDAPLWYLDQDGDLVGDENSTQAACTQPDGYVATGGDCDDLDSASLAGATWFVDGDVDGFGNEEIVACDQPLGTVATGGDCDDSSEFVYPGATEICNAIDDDCDEAIDEESQDFTTFFVDSDADGYGSDDETVEACEAPDGFVDNDSDCDDTNPEIHPSAVETCSTADEDCDGLIDAADPDAADVPVWYLDADGDSHGSSTISLADCTQPIGYVPNPDDCDDASLAVFPGAVELCDGIDQDCDASVDESALDAATWYADLDADGFGDAAVTLVQCELPAGYADNGEDCDDFASDVFPGAAETCDGEDDDCDGTIDNDPVDLLAWYADRDGDGFGNVDESALACSAPDDFVADATDCDDGSAAQNPDAVETCSGLDEDCDGLVDGDDPDMSGLAVWYLDLDGDNHGVATTSTSACSQPIGYALNGDDCDDADSFAFPGADETCDGTDEDCDGDVDEAALDAETWYADFDVDGYGDEATVLVECESPENYVATTGDCNDSDALTSPEGIETCDGEDEDCDGSIDENEWYADTDGDGFGDPTGFDASCVAPSGFVADASDCDDGDAAISPLGAEVCGGADEDCDGLTDDADSTVSGELTWYTDADGDGWGFGGEIFACAAPSGTVGVSGDCDGSKQDVSPDGIEVCGGADEDCDGLVDDADPDVTELLPWFIDADLDGYGTGTAVLSACTQPAGYAATADDCDDLLATISPAAYETCADGIDQDCDGADVTNCDPDGDGYDVSVDCDETNAAINPGAREICDAANADEDCDGLSDNDDSSALTSGKTRYYEDVDGDTYGDYGGVVKCDMPAGYVANGDDCNDGDAAISPAAQDVCDGGIDEDCTGEADDCYVYRLDDASTTFSGGSGNPIWSAAAGNFDGSGDQQIVLGMARVPDGSGNFQAGQLAILDWNGETTLSTDTAAATVGGSYYAYFGDDSDVGDTDGDGTDDLLSIRYNGGAQLFYGGDLSADAAIDDVVAATMDGYNLHLGDLDGDGQADLVGGYYDNGLTSVGFSFGPLFGAYTHENQDHYIEGMGTNYAVTCTGDFDGDGVEGLLASTSTASTTVYNDVLSAVNVGYADTTLTSSAAAEAVACGDVNGDGYADGLVALTGNSLFLVSDLTQSGSLDAALSGKYIPSYSFTRPTSIKTLDIDGNGDAEVAVGRHYFQAVDILDAWTGTLSSTDLGYRGVGATISGSEGYYLGTPLTNAGDVDGDGGDDLLIGASQAVDYDFTVIAEAWLWLGADLWR